LGKILKTLDGRRDGPRISYDSRPFPDDSASRSVASTLVCTVVPGSASSSTLARKGVAGKMGSLSFRSLMTMVTVAAAIDDGPSVAFTVNV
jgi:hypothetical protein